MKRNILALTLATVVFGNVSAGDANAYTSEDDYYCVGTHIARQLFTPVIMHRDICSIPDDTPQMYGYYAAADAWANVMGGSYMNPYYWFSNNCTVTIGDLENVTARVPRAAIDQQNGGTPCLYWPQCIISDTNLDECDVLIADDMSLTNEDESFWNWSNNGAGRATVVHEFGHFFGLGHSEWMSVMHSGTPHPIVGGSGSHAQPFPDDANGVRNFYGIGSRINMFVSAQKLGNNTIVQTNATNLSDTTSGQMQLSVARGTTVQIFYTVGNNGSIALSGINLRFFINKDGSPTSGLVLGGVSVNIPANQTVTGSTTQYIPSFTPTGAYFIWFELDHSNTVSEFNESDNVVHSAMTLNII